MQIEPTTLRKHLSRIYQKFGVCNAAGAVVKAAKAGMVELEVDSNKEDSDD
jgi:DNA-binding NarL/FixJ family response regulator